MDSLTAARLLAINRAFYETLAGPFAASRSAGQAGLRRLASTFTGCPRLLDVGCGNGRLALALEEAGVAARYTGVDASEPLLVIAAGNATGLKSVEATFVRADIADADWAAALPSQEFDGVALLAVLHHLPGWERRAALLKTLRQLLARDGQLAISTWQFLREERLRRKIVPWDRVGLSQSDLEPGDYLLDWRRGGEGLRYCHLVDEAELHALAAAAGLTVSDRYYADGAGQNLNLYATLRPRI